MRKGRAVFFCVLVSIAASELAFSGPFESDASTAVDRWELDMQTGALWSVGARHETPLDYLFVPAAFSVTSPEHLRLEVFGGDLVMRARFGLFGQAIVDGPENYFFGFTASPVFEWWMPGSQVGLFCTLGGGVGWMDAEGGRVEGAQGRDTNFHYFAQGGLRYRLSEDMTLNMGVMFQHVSNGGHHEINPGVDLFGPTLGLSFAF